MLTTTTLLLWARLTPLYIASEPEPVENPPPCSHTITGRLLLLLNSGVNTFSTRQSSLCSGVPGVPFVICGAVGPYARASRTPFHCTGLVGGMKRFLAAVVPPYGIPLKILTSSNARPRTLPAEVAAMTSSVPAAAMARRRESAWAAANSASAELPRKKLRRFRTVSM